MRVKRLEVNGFKSFADRTLVEFPSSMCAVVGPNGCGKSNVVDAVRWVLGEQSARQLRGQSMADVIFNGAAARKPAAMAEVSLVLENNGTVSASQFAELAEIKVTRRLFRNGDSEYLINKVPCRLKDIQQLFMDTGLGNRAYAIIEQGKVASFIEAKPEERRLWVEEAAGITRYKNQKKVSLRKMAATEDNLDRLRDIMHEVAGQMERARRQAKKAQRHKELRERLRELDLNITSHEYDRLSRELQEVGSEAEAVGAQRLLASQRVTSQETDLETLKVRLVTAEQDISQAGARALETDGQIQKEENELTLQGRELERLSREQQRFTAELIQLKDRGADQERQLSRASRLVAEFDSRLAQRQEAESQAAAHLAGLLESQRGREAAVDQAKNSLVETMSSASQARNRLTDLERSQQESLQRRIQLEERRALLEGELDSLSAQHQEAQEGLGQAKQEVEALGEEQTLVRQQLKQKSQTFKELRGQEQQASRQCHQVSASLEAMQMSLGSYEWAQAAVRKVLKAAEQGSLPAPLLGLVAELIQVEPGWEKLVETALGWDLQALVVQTGAQACQIAAWAQENQVGRLRVLALDDLSAQAGEAPAASRPLDQVVRVRPEHAALAALWSGTGLGSDLEQAWPAGTALRPGQVLVTDQGQRLDRPGAALVGKAQEGSILARRNQLEDRRRELELAQAQHQELTQRLAELQEALKDLEERESLLREELTVRESGLARQEQQLFRLTETGRLKRRELEGLEFDAEEIFSRLDRLEKESEELAARQEDLEAKRGQLEADLEKARQDLESGREELEAAREREADARLAKASLASEAEHSRKEAQRLERELKTDAQRQQQLQQELDSAQRQTHEITLRRQQGQIRLGDLIEVRDRQGEELRAARELMSQAQMQVSDMEGSLKQAREEHRKIEAASQELAFRARELTMQRDLVCDQAMERCRVDLTLDYQDHMPGGAFDSESARAKLDKLRQRLNNLGPVNLEAISEFEALSERHEFLSAQMDDLMESLEDLRKAVRKINQKSRNRFTETLAQVNLRLEEVFPVLFGGGSAQLVLEQGIDPLDAGLHMMVELPGKKVKNLEALSGGEKAMAAAATLFALFLIRPAPFCILDEVDAPLDEANVGRFHDLLRRLGTRSQILCVTHTRRTMEVMDLLYGVTMEEKGVSRLLAVDLKQGQSMAA